MYRYYPQTRDFNPTLFSFRNEFPSFPTYVRFIQAESFSQNEDKTKTDFIYMKSAAIIVKENTVLLVQVHFH